MESPIRKNIFAIIGSASAHSANQQLVEYFARLTKDHFNVTVFDGLKTLPHFDPELSINNPPQAITMFREQVEKADGVLICTPEYVFSIPSGLKNAIEWCVATTVFSGKPTALITASAHGQKGHEELQLIMNTLMAQCTALLIMGIKGKINNMGALTDDEVNNKFIQFIDAFKAMLS